jgi:hypothetical protein
MAIITTPDPVKTVKFSVERRRIAVGADRRIFSIPSVPNRLKVRRRNFFGLILPFMVLAGHSEAATYTVTNLNDSGTGSLRAAMLSANANLWRSRGLPVVCFSERTGRDSHHLNGR